MIFPASDFLILSEDMNILRRQLAAQEEVRLTARRQMAQREFEVMVQAGGYTALGKNDKERDLAKIDLLKADEAWVKADETLHKVTLSITVIQAELDCYHNTRRAHEYVVKALEAGFPLTTEERDAGEDTPA